jgi:hypothetical protein
VVAVAETRRARFRRDGEDAVVGGEEEARVRAVHLGDEGGQHAREGGDGERDNSGHLRIAPNHHGVPVPPGILNRRDDPARHTPQKSS